MNDASRRIRVDLAYDGTNYRGWQLQTTAPTVQGVLEAALARIEGDRKVPTRSAGRTDSGVHARGQVADARVSQRLGDAAILDALRAILPQDVRPLRLFTVADDFHPRRHAVVKTYRYRLDRSSAGSPFFARYTLHHPRRLDLAAVEDALARLPGCRDFSGFAASTCEVEDPVRDLREALLVGEGGSILALAFSANGFLTRMVRNMVGTLLEVGHGRLPAECIDEILATRDRNRAGPTAPAHALCLERVVYPAGPASGGESPWPIVE